MSEESKEKFRQLITQTRAVFESEKELMIKDSLPDKDLIGDIENALNKLS